MRPEEIKALRKFFGENQTQFARRLGVSLMSVSRWENGTRPSGAATKALQALAKRAEQIARRRQSK